MKSKLYIIAFTLISILFFYSFSFNEKSALEKVTEQYILRNTNFKNALKQFSQKVKELPFTKENIQIIHKEYFKLRTSFKKWEYLSEFMDPAFVKDHINGAPLQKMEPNSFGPNIIEPKGLQAIDELLFSEDVLQSKQSIISALNDISRVLDDQTLIKIYDRDVFIAARQGLVRL
jgi:cytochrome c peroxidase